MTVLAQEHHLLRGPKLNASSKVDCECSSSVGASVDSGGRCNLLLLVTVEGASMRRSGLTDEEKATIWQMVRAGSNWVQISRHLDRHISSVQSYAFWYGGVPPRARCRGEEQLTLRAHRRTGSAR
jgi:hypothetical protein